VLADQVRSIDRAGRGLKIVGHAPESIVAEVQGKLAALFGITW
jgi:mRNA-degrading endonuclease toxin of MazEF toxin-antitoxin module